MLIVLKKSLWICCSPTLAAVGKESNILSNTYGEWMDILYGVTQGSRFDPLLCNIFLCDHFLILHDIPVANYVNHSTRYFTGTKLPHVLIN